MNVTDLPAAMSQRVLIEPCPVAGMTDCWRWTGALTPKGYGQVYLDGRTQRAHRAAYEHLVGPIDNPMLDHLCRNRPCINPEHLEPVTNLINSGRSERATKTRCIRNHPLSGSNLIVKSAKSNGRRQCRECKRLSRAGQLPPISAA